MNCLMYCRLVTLFIFSLVPHCNIETDNDWFLQHDPYVINGVISSILDKYEIGEGYTVSCDPGHHMFAGTPVRICQYDYDNNYAYFDGTSPICLKVGTFSPEFECLCKVHQSKKVKSLILSVLFLTCRNL